MGRILFLTFFLFLTVKINADDFLRTRHPKMAFTLDVTPKAGFGNTFFLNSNVTADPNANRYFFCPSYFYGARLGLTFISAFPNRVFFSAYGEYLFSTFTQKYQMKDFGSGTNYDHSYSVNAAHKALVIRMTIFSGAKGSSGAMYLEVGKQISTISKVTETNTGGYNFNGTTNPTYKPSMLFTPVNNNIIFGIGGHGVMYSIGLRFTYGRGNLMMAPNQPISDGHYNNLVTNTDFTKYYSAYKETNLLMVELVFELNLYILEYGNATCGKKRIFPLPMCLNQDVIW